MIVTWSNHDLICQGIIEFIWRVLTEPRVSENLGSDAFVGSWRQRHAYKQCINSSLSRQLNPRSVSQEQADSSGIIRYFRCPSPDPLPLSLDDQILYIAPRNVRVSRWLNLNWKMLCFSRLLSTVVYLLQNTPSSEYDDSNITLVICCLFRKLTLFNHINYFMVLFDCCFTDLYKDKYYKML